MGKLIIYFFNFWKLQLKRSHWNVEVNGSKAQIDGVLRIQVHYYEDGNVQLLSKKDCNLELSVESGKLSKNPPVKILGWEKIEKKIMKSNNSLDAKIQFYFH